MQTIQASKLPVESNATIARWHYETSYGPEYEITLEKKLGVWSVEELVFDEDNEEWSSKRVDADTEKRVLNEALPLYE